MACVYVCVSHVQAHPGPTAAQAGGNPSTGRNRMFFSTSVSWFGCSTLAVYTAPKNGLLE